MIRWVTRWCAAACVCAAGVAQAGTVTLDNGITGVGHLDITVDDYGSYGRDIGPSDTDNFYPPSYNRPDTMSFVSENFVFMLAGSSKGAVALTSAPILWKLVEGSNQATGIGGNFPALGRVVNTGITVTNGVAHSTFTIGDSSQGAVLRVDLDQRISPEAAPAARFQQDYTFTNSSTAMVTFIFHAMWDMNLYYNQTLASDDFVGVGNGLCYVYMHEVGSTAQAGALADAGSTIGSPPQKLPVSAYYAGKVGVMPEDMLAPAFTSPASTPIWTSFGMPLTWKNQGAKIGKNLAGETGFSGDGTLGLEYQLALAAGQTATIRVARHYGTISLPCANVGVNCGNGTVDSGEACDSATDSTSCNANMCTAPMCGDNYVNTAAGETCESNGIDSVDCNGGSCTAPSCGDGYLNMAAGEMCDDGADTASCNLQNCQPPVCGDGIINDVAGEECDSNELCTDDCHWAFSLGGGCAGCSSSGPDASLLVLGALILRRRRRARRA